MRQRLSIRTLSGLAAAAIVLGGRPVGAQGACPAASDTFQRLAGGVKAEVRGGDIKAGETFEFVWRAAGRFPVATPAYLVLAVPGEVRFEAKPEAAPQTADGTAPPSLPGFMAFPGPAKAPFGMRFGSGTTRAVIPYALT